LRAQVEVTDALAVGVGLGGGDNGRRAESPSPDVLRHASRRHERSHPHPCAIDQGDPGAAERLLLLAYDEPRKLAAQKLAQEKLGQTLQATALVHEAYLRLVDGGAAPHWNSRGHFFAAAAEAMRRILVESTRRKGRLRHGRGRHRVDLESDCLVSEGRCLAIARRPGYR
jgi:hypothetical protein